MDARTTLAAAALAAAACGSPPAPRSSPAAPLPRAVSPSPAADGVEATVKRVVDGDTLLVTGLEREAVLVRLIGIDAPETGEGRTRRECFGTEAWRWLAERARPGSRVRLVFDVGERDRFDRRLAYVYVPDGTFMNAALVESGYARTMTIRPNIRHAGELQALERQARAKGRGLWSACGAR